MRIRKPDGESFFLNDGSSFPLRTKGRMDLIKIFSQSEIRAKGLKTDARSLL